MRHETKHKGTAVGAFFERPPKIPGRQKIVQTLSSFSFFSLFSCSSFFSEINGRASTPSRLNFRFLLQLLSLDPLQKFLFVDYFDSKSLSFGKLASCVLAGEYDGGLFRDRSADLSAVCLDHGRSVLQNAAFFCWGGTIKPSP